MYPAAAVRHACLQTSVEEEVLAKAYDSRLMRRLLGYLRPYAGYIALSLVFLVIYSALQICGPLLTKVAIDKYDGLVAPEHEIVVGQPGVVPNAPPARDLEVHPGTGRGPGCCREPPCGPGRRVTLADVRDSHVPITVQPGPGVTRPGQHGQSLSGSQRGAGPIFDRHELPIGSRAERHGDRRWPAEPARRVGAGLEPSQRTWHGVAQNASRSISTVR